MGQSADAAGLDWDGSRPVSRRYGDGYFTSDGLAETRHVFLAGNDLPARFRPGFHIAELGFGTGLNMLAALVAWRGADPGGALRFTGFEAHPLAVEDIARALAPFHEIAAVIGPFLGAWARGERRIHLDGIEIEVILGDARETLPQWTGRADAWFLDGFAPARNPELWEPPLLTEVARHAAPGATLASFTAAGHVRRALDAVGFEVERRPGFGRKRHMTVARLRDPGAAQ